MKIVRKNVLDWQLNQASALFGNEWFAVVVYLVALLFPEWHWAVLGVFLFAYLEFIMHWIVFNVGLKSWYNPGLWTATALTVLSIIYLTHYVPTGMFNWIDVFIAIVWVALNYWIGFRSPLFLYFNHKKQYSFSRPDVEKSRPYMKKFDIHPEDYHYLK